MLISFSVSNYRSFGEEVTLNMVASNKITDHPNHRVAIGKTGKHVLRAAVIYGANAAGKSNLVRAMAAAQRMIRGGSERLQLGESFRFQPDAAKQPTSFEFRFLLDEHVFVYGFDVSADRFESEWLCLVKANEREVVLFERDRNGKTEATENLSSLFPADRGMAEALGILKRLPLRENQLFLNRVRSLPEIAQGETLTSIVRWLTQDLLVLPVEHRSCDILERLHGDPILRTFCSQFLANVGTGIAGLDVQVVEREMSDWERRYYQAFGEQSDLLLPGRCGDDTDVRRKPDDPNSVVVRRLVTTHPISAHHFELPFGEESDGTQQLLHLLPELALGPNRSRVVVIDELDRSLHPLLCWEYLRFFSESCPGARRQLIVTTHEAHLLHQDLLRRDEYWFVEKDQQQQSRLVSLSDFNIRNDLQIQKGYLQGRFGAIPLIGAMDGLKKLLECPHPGRIDAAQETPD